MAVDSIKRWRPELRRAMMRVCPELFSWSVQERERYGVNISDKARQKLDRALMKELFGARSVVEKRRPWQQENSTQRIKSLE